MALKPMFCSARALPTSHGLGSTKQPCSCSVLKLARFSAVDAGMFFPFCDLARLSDDGSVIPPDAEPAPSYHPTQKSPLLRQDEFVLGGETEIRRALRVHEQRCAIAFIGRETLERNQREGDVIGSLMRHPVAQEIAATPGNDRRPSLGICFEHPALEWIDLVADEDGDGHGRPP